MAFRFKSARSDIVIHLNYLTPIMRWSDIPARFFQSTYDALSERINISLKDLSVASTNVLGDAWVKCQLFGGAGSITMQPERLIIMFSRLQPSDTELVTYVINSIHDAFEEEFTETSTASMSYKTFQHLELESNNAVTEFLQQFNVPRIGDVTRRLDGVYYPEVKFKIGIEDRILISASVERSLLSQSSIFSVVELEISDVETAPTFADRYQLVQRGMSVAAQAMDLSPATEGQI